MAIRFISKYGSKVPEEPEHNEIKGNYFDKLNAKLRYQRENILPFLGDKLFPYYRHSCILFISGKYVGQGYGTYTNQIDFYDQVGQILTTL